MTSDPNKKTPRTFQCREALWHRFEQMARELECSVDYLINDAMKQYARQRGYAGGAGATHAMGSLSSVTPLPGAAPGPTPSIPAGPPATPATPAKPTPLPKHAAASKALSPGVPHAPLPQPPAAAPLAPVRPSLPVPLPPTRPSIPQPVRVPGPPPLPTHSVPPPRTPVAPVPARVPPPPAIPAGRGAPPPMPRQGPPPPVATPARAPALASMAIYYGGERFPVNKERFIIGRGKQSSDLTIKDPNVSRQHAMVEFLHGQYYIVDMGSTNGVEYNGQRIQRKAINEGDVFKVCDHELRFSFH